jgi:hypothetical protein
MGELTYSSTILDLERRWSERYAKRPGRFTPVPFQLEVTEPVWMLLPLPWRESNPGRPAHIPSLYRLRYPGFFISLLCYPGGKSSRYALDKRLSVSQSLSGHYHFFFFSFFGWGKTESIWYVGHWLVYCTRPGWEKMSVEQLVEWELAGETEVPGENQSQCHFIHHKSHTTWPSGKKKNYSVGPNLQS